MPHYSLKDIRQILDCFYNLFRGIIWKKKEEFSWEWINKGYENLFS